MGDPNRTAGAAAAQLLSRAARILQTADPLSERELAAVLEDWGSAAPGERGYPERLVEPQFSETHPDTLSFVLQPGRAGALEEAARAMRQMVSRHFGSDALYWLDSRLEPVRGAGARTRREAVFGSGFDRDGVVESAITTSWGSDLMDALPSALYRLARAAAGTVPGLRPALSTVRCARGSGSQQITFESDSALDLNALRPLMDLLGLGHQHAGFMSACAFLLGARFTLPPNTALLSLRPTRRGVELRLDVMLDALPDPPPQLMNLLRMQLVERPKSQFALERWLAAVTPDDAIDSPGTLSVLSVRVRPDLPARIALYLNPSAFEPVASSAEPAPPVAAPTPPAGPVAGAPSVSAEWLPVGA